MTCAERIHITKSNAAPICVQIKAPAALKEVAKFEATNTWPPWLSPRHFLRSKARIPNTKDAGEQVQNRRTISLAQIQVNQLHLTDSM